MPGRKHCTCVPQEIRDIQHQCFDIQRDLLVIEDQIEAARQSIELPPNAPDIWNGNAPPTVEIEVHGALSVVVDGRNRSPAPSHYAAIGHSSSLANWACG